MISLYHHQIGSFAMLFVIVFLNFVCIVTIFLFLIHAFLDIELLIVHLIFGVSVEYWDYVHFCRGVEFLVSALAYEILGFPVIMLFFWFERVESDFGVCFMWLDFLVLFLLKLTLCCSFVLLNLSFYQFLKIRLFSMNFSVLFQLLHYLFGFRYCLVTRFYCNLSSHQTKIFQSWQPVVKTFLVKAVDSGFQFQFQTF